MQIRLLLELLKPVLLQTSVTFQTLIKLEPSQRNAVTCVVAVKDGLPPSMNPTVLFQQNA